MQTLTSPSSTQPTSLNRLDALLALRGLACLMVLIIHCNPPRNSVLSHSRDLSWLLFSHGRVGVWIFFCLSGYLMGKAFFSGRYDLSRQGVFNFWKNRALRILPLYLFSVMILAIFVYPDSLRIENWGALIKILTFTYGFSDTDVAFNAALWSLSTEVQFYAIVPFLYAAVRATQQTSEGGQSSRTMSITTLSLVVIGGSVLLKMAFWLALRDKITSSHIAYFQYIYAPVFSNLDVFFIGLLTNLAVLPKVTNRQRAALPKRPRILQVLHSQRKGIAIVLLSLLYLFTAHHLYHQELFNNAARAGSGVRTSTSVFIIPIVTAMVTSFFIYAFESTVYDRSNERLSFDALLRNPLRSLEVLGILSYGIYIWHVPVFQRVVTVFSAETPLEAFFKRLTAVFILSVVLSAVTYFVVERPAMQYKRYRLKDSASHSAQ